MRIAENGDVYVCETELLALLAKMNDEYSGKGMMGAYDGRTGGHSTMTLYAESDEKHAEITHDACGVSYVPREIFPDHVPIIAGIRAVIGS